MSPQNVDVGAVEMLKPLRANDAQLKDLTAYNCLTMVPGDLCNFLASMCICIHVAHIYTCR